MRAAERKDTFASAMRGDDKVLIDGDSSKAPPPASLTADIIRRGQENARAANAETPEQIGRSAEPKQALDARAQQAVLEKTFLEPPGSPDAMPEAVVEDEPHDGLPPDEPIAQAAYEPVYQPAREAHEAPNQAPNEAANTLPVKYKAAPVIAVAAAPAGDVESAETAAVVPAAPTVGSAATGPIERTEFRSVRESAAEWTLIRTPSIGFWDRFMRDASIFVIFFAVLVFVVLQIV